MLSRSQGDLSVGLLSLPIHADSLLSSLTVQLAFGRNGRGTRNPRRVGGRVVIFLWGLCGMGYSSPGVPHLARPPQRPQGSSPVHRRAPFGSVVVGHGPHTLLQSLPDPPTSYGRALPGPLGRMPWDWSLIPIPFPDLSKELMDLRKMLKKRWVWAGPWGWKYRGPLPPAASTSTQGSALASAPNTGRGWTAGALGRGMPGGGRSGHSAATSDLRPDFIAAPLWGLICSLVRRGAPLQQWF